MTQWLAHNFPFQIQFDLFGFLPIPDQVLGPDPSPVLHQGCCHQLPMQFQNLQWHHFYSQQGLMFVPIQEHLLIHQELKPPYLRAFVKPLDIDLLRHHTAAL